MPLARHRSVSQRSEPFSIPPHLRILSESTSNLTEDLSSMKISRFDHSIMHPLSFASRRDQASAAEVCKMSRDFWLAGLQSFNDGADANFIRSEQVNYAQACSVGESFEELLNTEISVSHYVLNYQAGCSFVRFQEGCGSSTGKSSHRFSHIGEGF
jgi:hypothetical protein